MGIKDNFSQAVKELWKKDGMEENGENRTDKPAQPTELDKYLTEPQQESAQPQAAPQAPQAQKAPQEAQMEQPAAPQQGGYQYSAGQQNAAQSGAPTETPYYRLIT